MEVPRRSESDEELLSGAGASTAASSRPSRAERREALRRQHMQQLAAEQFSNLIPLWQLLQHVVSALATSQAQLDSRRSRSLRHWSAYRE